MNDFGRCGAPGFSRHDAGRLGIVAGEGDLPIVIAREARLRGLDVVICYVAGEPGPGLMDVSNKVHRVPLSRPAEIIRVLQQERVLMAILAGKVWKDLMFRDQEVGDYIARYLPPGEPRNDDRLLLRFVQDLERAGIAIVPQVDYLGSHLAGKGTLSTREPSCRELSDARVGFEVAKHVGAADIGQTVVVKCGVVLAVEAAEGTDAAIMRGGEVGGPGAVVVKVAKPSQDPRFDMPAVGSHTIAVMAAAGASCLAVESGRTVLVDPEDMLALADRSEISVIGLTASEPSLIPEPSPAPGISPMPRSSSAAGSFVA
ncbi:MAG TPA: LpxI family protein, partial [Firmicutes bacterium]|nr:LpxI family protein [Bacillota bacterium]